MKTQSPNQPAFDFSVQMPSVDPAARQHSDTSKAAAEKVKRSIGKTHNKLIALLNAQPNTSADEASQILGLNFMNCRPRMNELADLGFIHKTGDEGKTVFGNAQEQYSLTAKGKQLAETL